jgi:hypothetical protein
MLWIKTSPTGRFFCACPLCFAFEAGGGKIWKEVLIMAEIKKFEASGLYAAQDHEMVYGPVDRVDAMGNPVIKNEVDPKHEGIPTGPGEIAEEFQNKQYPEVTGNEMFSNTDFPLLI